MAGRDGTSAHELGSDSFDDTTNQLKSLNNGSGCTSRRKHYDFGTNYDVCGVKTDMAYKPREPIRINTFPAGQVVCTLIR